MVSYRQVSASQLKTFLLLCLLCFLPIHPLSLFGLLRPSAAHWRYQESQRRAKSPPPRSFLPPLLFLSYLHFPSSSFSPCSYSPSYKHLPLMHLSMSLCLFLSFIRLTFVQGSHLAHSAPLLGHHLQKHLFLWPSHTHASIYRCTLA